MRVATACPSPLAGEGQDEGELPQKHKHALRLGLRLIAGMRKDDAENIMTARTMGGRFKSPEDLMRRAKLKPSAMLTLARADAFGSLDLGRRETLWDVTGLEVDELPLDVMPARDPAIQKTNAAPKSWRAASRAGMTEKGVIPEMPQALSGIVGNTTPCLYNNPGYRQSRFRDDGDGREDGRIQLPPLKQEEAVAEDYAVFGLSLRNHPMAFMREELSAKGMITAADLKKLANGKLVKIAGLVLFRQRPGTAKGTIFITMEDEMGAANLIVWPKVAETYRKAVFGAKVILCEGILQKESNVIHVVSRRLADWTPMLRRLQPEASAFGLRFGRGDEVAHASGGDARTSRVNSSWTDTLKSRDFR